MYQDDTKRDPAHFLNFTTSFRHSHWEVLIVKIVFLEEQQVGIGSSSVKFPALVDGRRVMCKISGEALDDHFGADMEGELNAFLKHRGQIETKARKLIEQQSFQPDGSILIRSLDIGLKRGQTWPATWNQSDPSANASRGGP